jgi:hypothetical protein
VLCLAQPLGDALQLLQRSRQRRQAASAAGHLGVGRRSGSSTATRASSVPLSTISTLLVLPLLLIILLLILLAILLIVSSCVCRRRLAVAAVTPHSTARAAAAPPCRAPPPLRVLCQQQPVLLCLARQQPPQLPHQQPHTLKQAGAANSHAASSTAAAAAAVVARERRLQRCGRLQAAAPRLHGRQAPPQAHVLACGTVWCVVRWAASCVVSRLWRGKQQQQWQQQQQWHQQQQQQQQRCTARASHSPPPTGLQRCALQDVDAALQRGALALVSQRIQLRQAALEVGQPRQRSRQAVAHAGNTCVGATQRRQAGAAPPNSSKAVNTSLIACLLACLID